MESPVHHHDSSASYVKQGNPQADLSAIQVPPPRSKKQTRKPAAPNLKKAKPTPPHVEYMNAAKRRSRSRKPKIAK